MRPAAAAAAAAAEEADEERGPAEETGLELLVGELDADWFPESHPKPRDEGAPGPVPREEA